MTVFVSEFRWKKGGLEFSYMIRLSSTRKKAIEWIPEDSAEYAIEENPDSFWWAIWEEELDVEMGCGNCVLYDRKGKEIDHPTYPEV